MPVISGLRPSRAIRAIALLVGLAGCQYIPGTKTHSRRHAEKLAADQLIDPSSAQFRNLRISGSHVCGEINGKNRMGAYVGFSRFQVDVPAKLALIDPKFELNDLISAEDLCGSMRANMYSSAGSTASACDRAEEERMKQTLQSVFDSAWSSQCRNAANL